MTTKFAGKEYPNCMTIGELARQLEVEGSIVVRYEKKKEPMAQEILDEVEACA